MCQRFSRRVPDTASEGYVFFACCGAKCRMVHSIIIKDGMPNNTVYQLADCYRTLNMYYEGRSRITCKDVHVYSVTLSGQI